MKFKKNAEKYMWILGTVAGSIVFAFGFALFLQPNDMNAGGVTGLAMVLLELLGFGSVGMFSIIINLPLFLLGGAMIGKRFFVGSLLGMALSSVLIDLFFTLPCPEVEPLVAVLYGGAICGAGLGLVFLSGASTGGSDILVRLLKLKCRNASVGQIAMCIDLIVVALTGWVFHDVTKALYTGITALVCGYMVDFVVYRFDYTKVVMIVSEKYDAISNNLREKIHREATFLRGHGTDAPEDTKVIMVAVNPKQVDAVKDLVTWIDPNAFLVIQEAQQVIGDGFSKYSRESL